MKLRIHPLHLAAMALLVTPIAGEAQQLPRPKLHEGSAVVRKVGGEAELLIRILCDEASRPEAGFTTEANRITRRETGGRYNMTNLRLRPWKDTDDVLITTGWGAAWIPRPTSSGGVLSLEVDVYPATFERNLMPVVVTYEMWQDGFRTEGGSTVQFEANCAVRDPEAPQFRTLPGR